MKKIRIALRLILFVLMTGLFLIGCDDGKSDKKEQYAGNLLILQAYGSSNTAAGATHSFVEIYNKSERAIRLDGISLYYAINFNEFNDIPWESIPLSGTIPAKGSFLVLGYFQGSAQARYKMNDDDGDIFAPSFSLSNRSFKVALIEGNAELNTDNPFDIDGSGKKIAGYIDMVGAVNTIDADFIFGYETAPARNSASEAVRRKNLIDTDDNSSDFIAARYASDGMSDEELEVRYPRNSSAGSWDPFKEPAGEYDNLPPTNVGTPSVHAGKLLILQIGSGGDDAESNVTHSFVELFNNSNAPINLNGISLQYAAGTKVIADTDKDSKWEKIDLEGTINPNHSFLILGPRRSTMNSPGLNITDESGDINVNDFILSNRAFKVALMESADLLTVQNPFNVNGAGGKAAGYIDMVGVVNEGRPDRSDTDQILGLEGTYSYIQNQYRISKQITVRRKSLTDTDVNSNDFRIFQYNFPINAALKDILFPKKHNFGQWDPFEITDEPEPSEQTERLMILQANTFGNADGGFARSLVELYNNTSDAINLDTGNYYLHIGNNTTPGWTNVIKLTNVIPAKSSYLIVSNTTPQSSSNFNGTPRAVLPTADQEADFVLVNNGFKVAVMINQSTILTVANPFIEASLTGYYIDMLGVTNTATGFENEGGATRGPDQSRPQITRRRNLTDTNNNFVDFERIDIRKSAMSDSELYKYWPRNSSAGQWNPMIGLPKIDPVVP